MATPSWVERFGEPSWPRVMSSPVYPFLMALDHAAMDEAPIKNLRGEFENVRIDTCQTPYKSFVLLSVPKKTRLRKPIRVRAA